MEIHIQYFDSYEVSQCNNQKYIVLVDELEETKTPIELNTMKYNNDNDMKEWRVSVVTKNGPEFQCRKKFTTQDSAKSFVDEIERVNMTCSFANLGINI